MGHFNRDSGGSVDAARAARLCGASAIAILACVPAAAWGQDVPPAGQAQPAEPPKTESIIITGIRKGLTESIDKKKNNLSIIESITAEDIGKLPATSVADSMAQLPGLALQRVDGRAQLATLRGFGPDYIATFLNERPIASARFSRAVSFDQFPAELLAGVDVYKTPNLDLSGMGLAGTIDLRTVQPLESNNVFAVNVKGEVNSLGHVNPDVSNKGWNANATFIRKFADDTIGFSIGYAHMDAPEAVQHTKDWYYATNPGPVSPASAAGDLFNQGMEATATSRRLVRDGVASSLEWKPDDHIHNRLDVMYSQFYQSETSRTIEGFATPAANANAAYTGVVTANVGGTPVAQSGQMTNWNADILESSNPEKEWLFAIGDHLEYTASDRFKVALDLSYSKDHDRLHEIQTQAGYLNPVGSATPFAQNDTLTFNVPFDGSAFPQYSTALNYADASNIGLGDPGTSAWGGWGQDGIIHDFDIRDKVYTADLTAVYELHAGPFENLDVGLNYQHHTKGKTIAEDNLCIKNDPVTPTGGCDSSASYSEPIAASDFIGQTGLAFAGLGPIAAYNIDNILNNYYNIVPFTDNNSIAKQWQLAEDFVTIHAKVTLNSGRLHGDVGAQLVYTKQTSEGGSQETIDANVDPAAAGAALAVAATSAGASYWNILPNANLIFDLQQGAHPLKLRLSAGETMQRPRTDDMISSGTASLGGPGSCAGMPNTATTPVNAKSVCWSQSSGNPELRPWRATGLDISLEKYFGGATYIALAGFYKHLNTFITTSVEQLNSSVFAPYNALAVQNGYNVYPYFYSTQPVNASGGKVWGMEISGAVDFGRITRALSGFGATASYAYTRSKAPAEVIGADGSTSTVAVNGISTELPGLSRNVVEVTAYYDKKGVQARVNYHYRSRYIGEVAALFGTIGNTYILSDAQMDAQIGYTFQPGSRLVGLNVTAQVQNLLDTPYRDAQNSGGLPSGFLANGQPLPQVYERYGRTYMLGVGYKF